MENKDKGFVWVNYIPITKKTTVNNHTVWHRNKFINFLLKIKYIFYKPKSFKS